ncbi:MAG TPA: c-type cytochrome [Xanthobacteraceae bacterium]|jgi:cytochrome c553
MINKHYAGIVGALVIAAALSAPGNAQQGVEAKLQICSSCHGAEGRPISPGIPIIWGQTEYFLTKQLHDYISGDRESPIMSSLAKTLTQPELRPAAKYFSAKPWPAKTSQAAAPAAPEGIALCQICHQQGFVGGLPAPRLAGQSYEYLLDAMKSFADGRRTNSEDMMKIMQGLQPAQMEAMARYISSL